ncbi:MAG: ABC transporter permease [Deltaproteobacteria bacterium]|nr:ABC transporter permease [Deltaproteobacteria bacterium]
MPNLEEWIGFQSVLKKEILRFWKVKSQTVFSPMINAALYLVVFGLSLSNVVPPQNGFSYTEFLIPGLAAMAALNNALQNSASSIMISKFHGDLQDLRIVPLSHNLIALAYVIACIVRGVIVAAAVLFLGELVVFLKEGHWMAIAHPQGFILFLCLGCAIFGNLGIWIGFISRTFDHIAAFTNFIILPLIYLGGVFFSLKILHPTWQTVATFNPLVYIINGIRWSLLGASDVSAPLCALVSVLFVAITGALAWYSVKYGSYQRF